MTELMHACAAALRLPGRGWSGVLLSGPSGAGKSDLLLRLVNGGWRAAADDYVHVWSSDHRLYARAPERIADRMEIRGLGITPTAALPLIRVDLVVRCGDDPPERLPEPAFQTVAGVRVPAIDIQALHASAPARLAVALRTLGAGGPLAY
ncbi:HPr kinase/phosphorylase [Brevundimonas sp.]|uniref:HPr kinase/phosphorylase n=1 Tax=Brevundimonas sp. TaxID=1871086 RepID=UPI0039E6F2F6